MVLHRPFEPTALTGQVPFGDPDVRLADNQDLTDQVSPALMMLAMFEYDVSRGSDALPAQVAFCK